MTILSLMELGSLVQSKQPDLSQEIVRLLLGGVEKDVLDPMVGGELGRMNLIGSLRAIGFQITGGRGGGKTYKLIGFEEKEASLPLDQWPHDLQSRVEFTRLYPASQKELERMIAAPHFANMDPIHESSLLQVLSYELGASATAGYLWEDLLVIERFPNRPAYKIHPFHDDVEEMILVAQYLGAISTKPVQIVGLSQSMAARIKFKRPKWTISKHAQAVYDTRTIGYSPEVHLSKQQMKGLRKAIRENEMLRVTSDSAAIQNVIHTWKTTVGHRQRQLSINRDFVAASSKVDGQINLLGMRGNDLISCHIFDGITGSNTMAQIVEKSLNYSWQPGGRSGTADWNLVRACQILSDMGYQTLNAGHIGGGSDGLAEHKLKLLDHTVYSYSVNTGLKAEGV